MHMLSTSRLESDMETILRHSAAAPRGLGPRAADVVFALPTRLVSAAGRLWGHWRAARQRAAELRALAELSPSVLRDIGVEPGSVHLVHRAEQRVSGRDAVMRLL